MASGPITSWQIDEETVTDLILRAPKSLPMVAAAMKLKSTDITLPTKVRLVKAMVFPVVTYGCESWTIKKAKRRRIDVFELWYWRTLESDFDCREIQPVNPKENRS